ncbi:MAG TPA: hypothetical protein VF139_04815 [Candidatus Polarisedimenticolaceae bacterium]
MDRLPLWLRVVGGTRTLVAPACVLVGAAFALHDRLPFRPGVLVACLLGSWLASFAGHLADTIFHPETPLSDRREPTVQEAATLAGASLALAAAFGFGVAWVSGAAVLGWALLGALAGAAYAVPPLALAQYGPGPAFACAFVALGPAAVVGGYAAQSSEASLGALVAALPVGVFAATTTQAGRLPREALALGVLASLAALALATATGDYPSLAWIAAVATIPLLAEAAGRPVPVPAPAAAATFAALVAAAFVLERAWPR